MRCEGQRNERRAAAAGERAPWGVGGGGGEQRSDRERQKARDQRWDV